MTHVPTSYLRDRGKNARRNLDADLHAKYSHSICRRFLSSSLFFRSKTIACYLPVSNEVDTSMIFERAWRARKPIFVPVVDDGHEMRFVQIERNTRLELNRFGIWEPVLGSPIAAKKLDVIATPLVAFDANLNRIGAGGGYFDRCFHFLRGHRQWSHPKLAGIAFECQRVEKILPKPWDIRLYRVFTEIH